MRFAGNRIFLALASVVIAANTRGAVELRIDVLESNGYALLKNKRVGLITNQTGVDSHAVRTRVLLRKNCNLVALCTPEHGLDGREKAGCSQPPTGISFSEYRSGPVGGSYLRIDPAASGNLTALNIYALAEINRQLRTNLIAQSKRGKREMFFKCYGSSSIASQFARGIGPAGMVASWTPDVVRFKGERSQYLIY
jgi:Protein of unknown function (DUF1343)